MSRVVVDFGGGVGIVDVAAIDLTTLSSLISQSAAVNADGLASPAPGERSERSGSRNLVSPPLPDYLNSSPLNNAIGTQPIRTLNSSPANLRLSPNRAPARLSPRSILGSPPSLGNRDASSTSRSRGPGAASPAASHTAKEKDPFWMDPDCYYPCGHGFCSKECMDLCNRQNPTGICPVC
jgi:hypothetical protein